MMTRKSRKIRITFIIRWYVEHMLSIFFFYTFMFCTCFLYCSARDNITTLDNLISDSQGETLVSTSNKFELGFFTPNGSSDHRRYVGMWYYRSNPQTVVWVANRDSPVLDNSGVFAIAEDGNLKVFDESGKTYWSTNLEKSASVNRTAKIMDTGNLVISDEDQESRLRRTLWQSFDNPTDTFLPGMKMDENIILTSWTSYDDPAPGNFTFQLDQEGESEFVIWKRSMRYWKSGVSGKFIGSDQMPSALSYLLSNFTSTIQNDTVPYLTSSLYSDTRMIMTFTGQIQYFKWKNKKVWSLIWAQPRDRCSVYNACGNFGICNSNDKLLCKCLPGFEPSLPQNWNSGDFSGGCSRKTTICGKNSESNTFLSLHMMNVGNPDSQFKAKNEMACKSECLNNCQCQAYSYQVAEITQQGVTDVTACWIWSVDLNNLQEEYEGGGNLNVRVAGSDIEVMPRTCEICGANLIPYPLSTGPKCGDAIYFNFHCNISTGQVSFVARGGTYRITRINPETRKFVIQTKDGDNCEGGNSGGKFLQLHRSSPFNVTGWCEADPFTGTNEVEISWEPPLQPTCSSSEDCKDWPNSSCNETGDGNKRCLCNRNFQWDSSSLSCIKGGDSKNRYSFSGGKMPLSLIIAVTIISIITLVCLVIAILYIYLQRRRVAKEQGNRGGIQRNLVLQLCDSERHVKDLIDSGQFKEEDAKGIDVPFFDLESILVATNNFSNANRLGQGGFGPVYKAQFPGGQQIAVKRLSSCSGQGLEEFQNEVVLIAKLQHRNLVRLMGYCVSGDEKMLLYEYMPNKSLDSFIFDQKLSMSLDWPLRYNIIFGVARGLLYLHQDSRLRIIHRDLKTSNILLDEEMNPKISDFGLARIFGGKETAANTKRVVGTYGYMSPEYALDGLFSFKSDVFSFGVVVLEIITGKRNTGFYQPEQNLSLLGYAWQLWKEDKALNLLDQTICENFDASEEVLKCVTVGLLCVQEDPSDRPTMSNVVFMLGSDTATLPTPKQPAFVVRRCASSRASSFSKPETFSQNELTVTLEDGR